MGDHHTPMAKGGLGHEWQTRLFIPRIVSRLVGVNSGNRRVAREGSRHFPFWYFPFAAGSFVIGNEVILGYVRR